MSPEPETSTGKLRASLIIWKTSLSTIRPRQSNVAVCAGLLKLTPSSNEKVRV